MKYPIYEVWGQCARCNDAFSVYLHQRPHRTSFTYRVEPSPHLDTQYHPSVKITHTHNDCGGLIQLFGAVPTPDSTTE